MGELGKPRPDRGQRSHKATRPQQVAAGSTPGAEIPVNALLIDLVHMQQPVGGARVKRSVLEILADDAGALFIAAAKKIAAIVMVVNGVVFAVVVVRHQFSGMR